MVSSWSFGGWWCCGRWHCMWSRVLGCMWFGVTYWILFHIGNLWSICIWIWIVWVVILEWILSFTVLVIFWVSFCFPYLWMASPRVVIESGWWVLLRHLSSESLQDHGGLWQYGLLGELVWCSSKVLWWSWHLWVMSTLQILDISMYFVLLNTLKLIQVIVVVMYMFLLLNTLVGQVPVQFHAKKH